MDSTVWFHLVTLQEQGKNLSEFLTGFAFGALIIGLITTPFLMFFGIVYFNLRRMENQLTKESEKPEPTVEIDKDVFDTVKEAESLIAKTDTK